MRHLADPSLSCAAAGGSAAAEDVWALPGSRPSTSDRDGASGAASAHPPLTPGGGPARVRALADEMERKRGLFEDDAAFIAEVRAQALAAPGDGLCCGANHVHGNIIGQRGADAIAC